LISVSIACEPALARSSVAASVGAGFTKSLAAIPSSNQTRTGKVTNNIGQSPTGSSPRVEAAPERNAISARVKPLAWTIGAAS
jgi:hypothetical protein